LRVKRLTNSITYCSDIGTVSSWVDHFLYSSEIDQLIVSVGILYNYITSDHKPLLLLLSAAQHVTDSVSAAGQSIVVD